MPFYGRNYHLCSCDEFTRQHLESEGIDQKPNEVNNLDAIVLDQVMIIFLLLQPIPQDRYKIERLQKLRPKTAIGDRLFSQREKSIRQYLENDRKVLRLANILVNV